MSVAWVIKTCIGVRTQSDKLGGQEAVAGAATLPNPSAVCCCSLPGVRRACGGWGGRSRLHRDIFSQP